MRFRRWPRVVPFEATIRKRAGVSAEAVVQAEAITTSPAAPAEAAERVRRRQPMP